MEDINAQYNFIAQYLTQRRQSLFEEVLQNRTKHLVTVVEDVSKERNAGAIVRTSECLGIQDVHIIENNTKYKLSKGIAKGSDKWVNIHLHDKEQQNNTKNCFDLLKQKGYKIIACSPNKNDCYLEELAIEEPMAIVFGGEKEGLSEYALNAADQFLKIPLYGFTESYNMSVSAGIILSSLVFRLHQSEINWQLKEEEKMRLKLEWAIKTVPNAHPILKKLSQ